jgi:hypothetical protein
MFALDAPSGGMTEGSEQTGIVFTESWLNWERVNQKRSHSRKEMCLAKGIKKP